MKTKTARISAIEIKEDSRPRPDPGLLRRMKDRVQSMPFERGLFDLVRELENQETRYDAAKILAKIKNVDSVVSFLYLCGVNSKDDDFKTLVIDMLHKVGNDEARKAADDVLARKNHGE